MIGIYKITNILNKKVYIGSSNNIERRWKGHIRDLDNNRHHSILLQRAWNKYGAANFKFEQIFSCAEVLLLNMEQLYLDCYFGKNCYNINPIASKPPRGKGRKATGKTYLDDVKNAIICMRSSDVSFSYIGRFFDLDPIYIGTCYRKWTQKTKY